MFCSNCGSRNDDSSHFCQQCGQTISPLQTPPPPLDPPVQKTTRWQSGPVSTSVASVNKSPLVATLLSLIPGVGQFYNGDTKKGVVMLLITLVGNVMTAGLAWFPMFIWAAVDAYNVASGKGRRW